MLHSRQTLGCSEPLEDSERLERQSQKDWTTGLPKTTGCTAGNGCPGRKLRRKQPSWLFSAKTQKLAAVSTAALAAALAARLAEPAAEPAIRPASSSDMLSPICFGSYTGSPRLLVQKCRPSRQGSVPLLRKSSENTSWPARSRIPIGVPSPFADSAAEAPCSETHPAAGNVVA